MKNDNSEKNTSNILGWLLTGAALGAIGTLVFLPKTRDSFKKNALQARKDIVSRKDELANSMSDKVDNVEDILVDKIDDLANYLKEKARTIRN